MNVHVDPLLSSLRRSGPMTKFWFCIVNEPAKFVSIPEIQEAVAAHYGLLMMDLTSMRRTQREVMPRHVAMYLCRRLTKHSHETIAHNFDRADHTMSVYAEKKIERLASSDRRIAMAVSSIIARLQ